jgi:uncharacterized protein YqhQ
VQIGGMALRDGVLFISESHWAAAVRRPDGSMDVESGTRTRVGNKGPLGTVPLVRGVTRLFDSFSVLPAVRRRLGPVLPQEDPRLLVAAGASSLVGTALRRSKSGSPLVREAMVALVTLAPALLALRDSRLAGFHGAEHKSVDAVERHTDPATAHREHDRCGTMLVAPLLATTALTNMALRRAGAERNPAALLLGSLVSIGGAVEMFAWMGRHKGHPLAELLRRPGLQLQRMVTTAEPSADQLEVAQAAMEELLRLEDAGDDVQAAPAAI